MNFSGRQIGRGAKFSESNCGQPYLQFTQFKRSDFLPLLAEVEGVVFDRVTCCVLHKMINSIANEGLFAEQLPFSFISVHAETLGGLDG